MFFQLGELPVEKIDSNPCCPFQWVLLRDDLLLNKTLFSLQLFQHRKFFKKSQKCVNFLKTRNFFQISFEKGLKKVSKLELKNWISLDGLYRYTKKMLWRQWNRKMCRCSLILLKMYKCNFLSTFSKV